jgi:triphosphatase
VSKASVILREVAAPSPDAAWRHDQQNSAGALEHEVRFRLEPDSVTLLLDLPMLQQAGPPKEQELRNTYFDTAKFHLARAGCSLRIRRGAKILRQTLKVPASGRSTAALKLEFERNVSTETPELIAVELDHLHKRLRLAVAKGPLNPVFSTQYKRQSWDISYGASVVELALDRGEISGGKFVAPICEVELELKRGNEHDLLAFAIELCQQAPLAILPESKSARGARLARRLKPIPRFSAEVKLKRGIKPQAAFAQLAFECHDQFTANLLAFGDSGAPEAIHQMRVALRRLGAVLWLFKPLFDGPIRKQFSTLLRSMHQTLAPARAADVFARETLPTALAAANIGAAEKQLVTLAERMANSEHLALAKLLQSEGFSVQELHLQLLLVQVLSQLAQAASNEGKTVELKHLAMRRLTKLHRQIVKSTNATSEPTSRHFHVLRLRFKKQRYLAELLGPLFKREKVRRYVKGLAKWQDVLGKANDIAVSQVAFERLEEALAADGNTNSVRDVSRTLDKLQTWRNKALAAEQRRNLRKTRKIDSLKLFF